jgi:hypothetical protein
MDSFTSKFLISATQQGDVECRSFLKKEVQQWWGKFIAETLNAQMMGAPFSQNT